MSAPEPSRARIVVIDTTAGALSSAWSAGLAISGAGHKIRAGSWVEACKALEAAVDEVYVDNGPDIVVDLQFWGHGNDGAPMIDGKPPRLADLAIALGGVLDERSSVWWRVCLAHAGGEGHRFAARVTDKLGIRSIGHCAVISLPNPLRHRAICGLRVGEDPWWPEDGAGLPSCSMLRMEPPEWAFRRKP